MPAPVIPPVELESNDDDVLAQYLRVGDHPLLEVLTL
jgi:hypothetical protein